MSKSTVLFAGSTGKLGLLIEDEIKPGPLFKTLKVFRTTEEVEFLRMAGLPETLYLDVSLAEGARTRLALLLKNRIFIPTVIGCTGFDATDTQLFLDYSEKAPLLLAPNFSVGMTLMIAMLEQYSAALNDLQAEFAIEETHHTQKLDSPSGSAKALKAALHAESPILSHRIGDVIGQHEVRAHLEHETLKWVHEAHDRKVFATGAIRALRWIENRKTPGLFSMRDVLFTNPSFHGH